MPSGRELNDNVDDVQFQEDVQKWVTVLRDEEDVVVEALTSNESASEAQIEAAYQVIDERQRNRREDQAA